VLRANIVQHFASVDHAILLDILGRILRKQLRAEGACGPS
jgi:hypothetical protein